MQYELKGQLAFLGYSGRTLRLVFFSSSCPINRAPTGLKVVKQITLDRNCQHRQSSLRRSLTVSGLNSIASSPKSNTFPPPYLSWFVRNLTTIWDLPTQRLEKRTWANTAVQSKRKWRRRAVAQNWPEPSSSKPLRTGGNRWPRGADGLRVVGVRRRLWIDGL